SKPPYRLLWFRHDATIPPPPRHRAAHRRGRRQRAAKQVARRLARCPDAPHPDLRRDHRFTVAAQLLRQGAERRRQRAGARTDADSACQQSAASPSTAVEGPLERATTAAVLELGRGRPGRADAARTAAV